MRTARSSSRPGGLHQTPRSRGTPLPPGPGTPAGADPPGAGTPPMNRITDTCKNITFPQLRLRAVNMANCFKLVVDISLTTEKQRDFYFILSVEIAMDW